MFKGPTHLAIAVAALALGCANSRADDSEHWIQVLRDTRGASFTSKSQRADMLARGIEALKGEIKSKFSYDDAKIRKWLSMAPPKTIDPKKPETADETAKRIEATDAAAFRTKLMSCDGKNCKLRDFYTEVNLLAGTLMADGQLGSCKDHFDPQWIKDQSLTQSIFAAQNNYQPHCEGTGSHNVISIVVEKPKKPGDPKNATYSAWPLLYGGDAVGSLVNQAGPILRQSYVDAPVSYLGSSFPAKDSSPYAKKLTNEEYAAIKAREDLKNTVYQRAVTNTLKTKLAFQNYFGQKSYGELFKDISNQVDAACTHCTAEDKKRMGAQVLNSVYKSVPKARAEQNKDPKNLVLQLCKSLKDSGYYETSYTPEMASSDGADYASSEKKAMKNQPMQKFDPKSLKNLIHPSPAPGMLITMDPKYKDTPEYARMVANQQAIATNAARRQALTRIVNQGNQGLLLVTDALTSKDGAGNAKRVNLRCEFDDDSLAKDMATVTAAIAETDKKLGDYLGRLDKEISPITSLTSGAVDKQKEELKVLVKDNAIAAGEALGEQPIGANSLCQTLTEIYDDELAKGERKAMLKVGLLSANILSMGLLSVPSAIIGGLTLASEIGIVTAGVEIGSKIYDRAEAKSEQEKVLDLMRYSGQQGNEYLGGKSAELYQEYQSLRLDWSDALNLGMNAVQGLDLFKYLAVEGKMTASEMKTATGIYKETHTAEQTAKMTVEEIGQEMKAINAGIPKNTAGYQVVADVNTAEKSAVLKDFMKKFKVDDPSKLPKEVLDKMEEIHLTPTKVAGKINRMKAEKINEFEAMLKEKYGFATAEAQQARKNMTTTGILGQATKDPVILKGQVEAAREAMDNPSIQKTFGKLDPEDVKPSDYLVYKIEKDGKTVYGNAVERRDVFEKLPNGDKIKKTQIEYRLADDTTVKVVYGEKDKVVSSMYAGDVSRLAQSAYTSKAVGQVSETGVSISDDLLRINPYKAGEKFNPANFVATEDEIIVQRMIDEAPVKYKFVGRQGDQIVLKNSAGETVKLEGNQIKSLTRSGCADGPDREEVLKYLKENKGSVSKDFLSKAPSITKLPVGKNPFVAK